MLGTPATENAFWLRLSDPLITCEHEPPYFRMKIGKYEPEIRSTTSSPSAGQRVMLGETAS